MSRLHRPSRYHGNQSYVFYGTLGQKSGAQFRTWLWRRPIVVVTTRQFLATYKSFFARNARILYHYGVDGSQTSPGGETVRPGDTASIRKQLCTRKTASIRVISSPGKQHPPGTYTLETAFTRVRTCNSETPSTQEKPSSSGPDHNYEYETWAIQSPSPAVLLDTNSGPIFDNAARPCPSLSSSRTTLTGKSNRSRIS